MLSPFSAANLAISANHILWMIFVPIVVWLIPWDWPDWLALVVFVGVVVGSDLVVWLAVYFAAKRGGWDPVSRRYRELSDAG